MKIRDCNECMEYLDDVMRYEILLRACASVALSKNKSTEEMLITFVNVFHHGGHVDQSLLPGGQND